MKKKSRLIVILVTCISVVVIGAGVAVFALLGGFGGGSSVITLDAGAGVQLETTSIEVTKGEEYRLPTPSRVGYNFLGWKNGDENFSSIGIWGLKDDVTLTARWESKTYNVTLDTQGGTLVNSTYKVAYGEAFTLPIPTKDGNEFVCWKYNGEPMQNGTWSIDLDGIELVAEWNPSVTKITFDLNGGQFINTTATTANVAFGTDYTFPAVENGSHKIFKCWKNLATGEEFGTSIIWNVKEQQITLTAIWLNDKHTVRVNLNGATEFDCELEQKVECGTVFTLPTVAKKGYVFLGWYEGETKITTATLNIQDDVVLDAKWEKIKTTIKYSGEGITFENDLVEYGTAFTLETLGSEYYGWRIKDTKQYIPYTGTAWFVESTEITLEPVLNTDVCLVKFSGDYVDIADKVYTKGEIVVAPIPTVLKPGYDFGGWAKKGSSIPVNFNNAWVDTGSVELVAIWKIKNFTISFDANGGEFEDGTTLLEYQEVVTFGESYDFTEYSPTYAGYEFIGWMYDDNFIGPVNPEDLFLNGLIILDKGEWNFDGITTLTLKAVYISLDTGFGPEV